MKAVQLHTGDLRRMTSNALVPNGDVLLRPVRLIGPRPSGSAVASHKASEGGSKGWLS